MLGFQDIQNLGQPNHPGSTYIKTYHPPTPIYQKKKPVSEFSTPASCFFVGSTYIKTYHPPTPLPFKFLYEMIIYLFYSIIGKNLLCVINYIKLFTFFVLI